MGKKNKKVIVDDMERLKLFLFSAKEYIRFSDYFICRGKKRDINEQTEEDRYIGVQTLLMIVRKFENNTDPMYLGNVLESALVVSAGNKKKVQTLKKRIDTVEKEVYELVLSDGTKLDLHHAIEDVQYGLFLHVDPNRVPHLLLADEETFLYVTSNYLAIWDVLIRDTYALVDSIVDKKITRSTLSKAPIIFKGTDLNQAQDIKSAPYWSNLRGKDADSKRMKDSYNSLSEDDKMILHKAALFIKEIQKESPEIKLLRKYVFPPTKSDWGDFSDIHNELQGIDFGFSNKVRYNKKGDIAYVLIFPNMPPTAGFMIDQPQYSRDIKCISFVKDNEKWGWRIIHVGEKVVQYKMSGSIFEWFKYIIKENRAQHRE